VRTQFGLFRILQVTVTHLAARVATVWSNTNCAEHLTVNDTEDTQRDHDGNV
jgi:hypothetical protein